MVSSGLRPYLSGDGEGLITELGIGTAYIGEDEDTDGCGRHIVFGDTNILIDEDGTEHYPMFAAAFMDSMYDMQEIEYKRGFNLVL